MIKIHITTDKVAEKELVKRTKITYQARQMMEDKRALYGETTRMNIRYQEERLEK